MYNLHYNVNDVGGENDDDAGWSTVGEDQISTLNLSRLCLVVHCKQLAIMMIMFMDDDIARIGNVHEGLYYQNW